MIFVRCHFIYYIVIYATIASTLLFAAATQSFRKVATASFDIVLERRAYSRHSHALKKAGYRASRIIGRE